MAFSRRSTHNRARTTPSKTRRDINVADPTPALAANSDGRDAECCGRQQAVLGSRLGIAAPIGSLIFLFVGKDDPDVKYNAAQATIIHGAFLIIAIVISIVFFPIYFVWALLWFIVWLVGLVMSLQHNGARFDFPVLGPMVAKYVPAVEGWAK